MTKILLILILFFQSGYAFLITQNNYEEQALVLKKFDIDSSFLRDQKIISMKENMNRYKTKHFLNVLKNGNRFVPYLRKLINKSGIPSAFLYMAMAESNFTPDAYSKSRASGMWQFMPYTAKKFGLRINRYLDERRDPIKSTIAAIKYLKYLHKIFGKWYLAALAYNCGEGRVLRAKTRAKTDNLEILLNPKKKYLPRESRMYIRKILMMQNMANSTDFILENNSAYLLNQGSTETFSKVFVKQGTSLGSVASSIGISLRELKAYNPQLRYYFVPPMIGKYHIYIPYNKQIAFKQNFNPKKSKGRFFAYRVKRGDSLQRIGKKYRISYRVLREFNHLKSNFLRVNQSLIIPSIKPPTISYIAKNGDTISKISRKYKVAINKIIRANHKKSTMIKIGEKLVIPQIY